MNQRINLYLDDLRDCPEGFVIARTVDDAKYYFDNFQIEVLSLDHDLGGSSILKRYEREEMFNIVKKAIDEFNPYGLLPEAPNDEFDSESSKITGQINVNNTTEEIAKIISTVLSKAFDENFDIKKCMVPAEKIYKSMKNK